VCGVTPAGEDVEQLDVTNARGMGMRVLTLGGIIVSLTVPDRAGAAADVVLGYDTIDEYLRGQAYLGAIVGRCAGRIAGARFTLNGATYRLTANDGANHLHGGYSGFDRATWQAEVVAEPGAARITLSYTSRDGEEGYPGTVATFVTYTLTDRNELVVDYRAETDRTTHVNLTQHSYFNLGGAGSGDILGHQLRIDADRYLPLDDALIPTGAEDAVDGGPFDFRRSTPVGARIGEPHQQLRRGGGYDHTFVLNRGGSGLVHAARLVEPLSGRTLDVHTTEPGVHLFSGNFAAPLAGKGGRAYPRHAALCLETQHHPDAPNRPGFPSTILRPGSPFSSRTVFAFGCLAPDGHPSGSC
jgi:aldose 1-epimerase